MHCADLIQQGPVAWDKTVLPFGLWVALIHFFHRFHQQLGQVHGARADVAVQVGAVATHPGAVIFQVVLQPVAANFSDRLNDFWQVHFNTAYLAPWRARRASGRSLYTATADLLPWPAKPPGVGRLPFDQVETARRVCGGTAPNWDQSEPDPWLMNAYWSRSPHSLFRLGSSGSYPHTSCAVSVQE